MQSVKSINHFRYQTISVPKSKNSYLSIEDVKTADIT